VFAADVREFRRPVSNVSAELESVTESHADDAGVGSAHAHRVSETNITCKNSCIDRSRSSTPALKRRRNEVAGAMAAQLLRARTSAQGIRDRMSLNSESLSTHPRQEFCLAMKAARERNGITLAEIADATKIPASLFAALERNDLRRWPKGLFRRSFFRDYARMIGVPVGEACAEFVRLFPDDAGAGLTAAAGAALEASPTDEARLVLDAAWHGPRASVRTRLLAALIDAGTVILAAAALAWVAGMDRPATTAIVALAYFSLATALFGKSPAKWVMSNRRSIVDALAQGGSGIAAAWRRGAGLLGSAGTAEPVEQPEMRPWITDAHRVGPAPRLRVRIKVS